MHRDCPAATYNKKSCLPFITAKSELAGPASHIYIYIYPPAPWATRQASHLSHFEAKVGHREPS